MKGDQNEKAGVALVKKFLCCQNAEVQGWVYLIVCPSGRIKIGSATSCQGVRRQLTSVQTLNSSGIARVVLIHGGKQWERVLHQRFAAERLRLPTPGITSQGVRFHSEWFSGPVVTAWLASASKTPGDDCEYCVTQKTLCDLDGAPAFQPE